MSMKEKESEVKEETICSENSGLSCLWFDLRQYRGVI